MRKIWNLGLVGVLALVLAGCGGDGGDHRITAPERTVRYTTPSSPGVIITARILSDQPTDGNIAHDPVTDIFTVTKAPSTILFGIDSADPHQPEYRAFLDFPLDGSAGGDIIPLNASIVSAWLKVSVDFVDFAATVPVLLDLVQYSVATGLTPADYSSAFLASLPFDIWDTDAGSDVSIEVTSLMIEAQGRGLADFQVRFLLGP